MMRPTSAIRAALAVTLFTASAVTPAQQPYPVKPIRFITSSVAGAPIDLIGRIAGNTAQERLGQPFVYENRPGANTNIAADACVKSAPDGYTICLITNSLASNAYLYPKLPFDYIRDLDPVTLLAIPFEGLVVDGALPVNNLRELIAHSACPSGQAQFRLARRRRPAAPGARMAEQERRCEPGPCPVQGRAGLVARLSGGRYPGGLPVPRRTGHGRNDEDGEDEAVVRAG